MKKLILVVSILSLSSCALLRDLFAAAFQTPTFNLKTVQVTDVSLGGLTLNMVYALDNPNQLSLSLAEVDYALFIDGKQVVAGAPPRGLQVPAASNTEIVFPAQVKFADLAAVVETFLTKDKAHYRAEGHIGVETPIGVLKFPISKDGDFEVPKLPQVAFNPPRVTAVGLAGATFEFPLRVTNRNTFSIPVSSISGALSIANSQVGTLSTGDLGNLQPGVTREVSLPLQVSFLGAASAIIGAAQGGSAPIRFDAKLQSGSFALPLRVEQTVRFTR